MECFCLYLTVFYSIEKIDYGQTNLTIMNAFLILCIGTVITFFNLLFSQKKNIRKLSVKRKRTKYFDIGISVIFKNAGKNLCFASEKCKMLFI